MPLTVITIKSVKPSLKGDLSKWMQEISTGVYVGNFNSKIREKLWERIKANIVNGEATLSYYCNNEIGYNFEIYNSPKEIIDYEGIPLVYISSKKAESVEIETIGYSNAYKFNKARKFSSSKQNKNYVIVYIKKVNDNKLNVELIKYENDDKNEYSLEILDNEIRIIKEYVKDYCIIGYDIRDIFEDFENNIIDLKKYVKQDKMFLKNYYIETVLQEYEIKIEGSIKVRNIEELKNKLNEK